MAWKRKKKKEETAEELKARLKELEESAEEEDQEEQEDQEEDEELPEAPQQIKKKKEIQTKEKPKGEFSLNENEMALAVNALASSEEFKVYRQMVIGQQIAGLIDGYNKVVRRKNGESSEEELPTE